LSAYPEHIEEFLRLLESSPEFRAAVRALLLPEELLRLPELVRSLATAQERLTDHLATFQQTVEQALAGLAARIDELATRVESQIEALTQRMDRVEAQIEALTARMDRVEAQIEALTQRIDDLTVRMERVEAQIEALTHRMERVEAQIEALTQRVGDLTQRMERVEAQIEALTQRMERVEAQIEALTQRMERVEAQIEALTQRMERVEAQIEALTQRMERVEAQIEALTQRMERVEAQIEALTQRVDDLTVRMGRVERDLGRLKGLVLPLLVERRFGGLFRKVVRRPRVLTNEDLTRLVEDAVDAGLLSELEAEQLLLADLVIEGRETNGSERLVYLVCEISWGVGPSDVQRARERAAILERIGRRPARAVVLGTWLTREGEELLADAAFVPIPESFFD